jgi:hypothetical protein
MTTLCPSSVRHYLRHRGWLYVYEAPPEGLVTITRSYYGRLVQAVTMPAPQAREHYQRALRAGFAQLAGDL